MAREKEGGEGREREWRGEAVGRERGREYIKG